MYIYCQLEFVRALYMCVFLCSVIINTIELIEEALEIRFDVSGEPLHKQVQVFSKTSFYTTSFNLVKRIAMWGALENSFWIDIVTNIFFEIYIS